MCTARIAIQKARWVDALDSCLVNMKPNVRLTLVLLFSALYIGLVSSRPLSSGAFNSASLANRCEIGRDGHLCTGSQQLKIEVVMIADVVCPYCYIGYWRLRKAVSEAQDLGLPLDVQIKYMPFILRRHMSKEGVDKATVFSKQFGSEAQAQRVFAGISHTAAADGLCFDGTGQRAGNSEDAHRLLQWAGSFGKSLKLYEKLVYAYNCERGWLGDHEVLLSSAGRVGLDLEEARRVLGNASYGLDGLEAGLRFSRSLGVSSVPYFVVNNSQRFSGAISTSEFVRALQAIVDGSM